MDKITPNRLQPHNVARVMIYHASSQKEVTMSGSGIEVVHLHETVISGLSCITLAFVLRSIRR